MDDTWPDDVIQPSDIEGGGMKFNQNSVWIKLLEGEVLKDVKPILPNSTKKLDLDSDMGVNSGILLWAILHEKNDETPFLTPVFSGIFEKQEGGTKFEFHLYEYIYTEGQTHVKQLIILRRKVLGWGDKTYSRLESKKSFEYSSPVTFTLEEEGKTLVLSLIHI